MYIGGTPCDAAGEAMLGGTVAAVGGMTIPGGGLRLGRPLVQLFSHGWSTRIKTLAFVYAYSNGIKPIGGYG